MSDSKRRTSCRKTALWGNNYLSPYTPLDAAERADVDPDVRLIIKQFQRFDVAAILNRFIKVAPYRSTSVRFSSARLALAQRPARRYCLPPPPGRLCFKQRPSTNTLELAAGFHLRAALRRGMASN